MPNFTGEESAADIMRMAVKDFSNSEAPPDADAYTKIIYKDNTPFLEFSARTKKGGGDFLCLYRLDEMLLAVFPECERLYDEAAESGIAWGRGEKGREKGIRLLAFGAMTTLLRQLMLRQVAMFEGNLRDTMFFTAVNVHNALAYAYEGTRGGELTKRVNATVREMLDTAVEASTKKRREYLVQFLNVLPALNIPLGKGRPKGSVKPAEKKAQEAAEFERRIENTIRLLSVGGDMPTKTAVARALGIGGLNPSTGIDSSLAAFRNRLERLNVDYSAIVERVRLNK